MNIIESKFQLDQFDSIPSKPGLYCWLAQPKLSNYSWKLQRDESEEDRTMYLLQELTSFCDSSALHSVKSEVTAFFDNRWSGKLEYRSIQDSKEAASEALKSYCKNSEERRLLVDLIKSSFPLFWQPLYIGVAKNLKVRLSTHKRVLIGSEIDDFAFTKEEKDDFESAKSLGERLRACNYKWEHLWVYTLSINESDLALDRQRIRKISEVAERWLNILNTPKLGKK
jgi:hypothetical protein